MFVAEVRPRINIIDKKLEVWKVDTEVNIVDSLTKILPNQHFNALRGHMGLQQEFEQRVKDHKNLYIAYDL